MTDTTLEKLITQCQERMESIFGQCGIWVKASERLPEMEVPLFIRDNIGIKRLGNFYLNDEDGYHIYICPNGAHDGYTVNTDEDHFAHYEWLDEPNNNSAKITFAFKELFDFAKNDL